MSLNLEISQILEGAGCKIFGYANLRSLPAGMHQGLDFGIIMGVPYTPQGMIENLKGNHERLAIDSEATIEPLERFERAIIKFLKERKYKASITYRKTGYSNGITHKIMGTLSGLGWIGRCAILTTEKYGPALRLTAVLTNAPLECGKPITKSLCPPECNVCENICPTNAIKEGLWEQGIHRDTFFDVNACRKKLNKSNGVCGLCISACPLTKRGLGYELKEIK